MKPLLISILFIISACDQSKKNNLEHLITEDSVKVNTTSHIDKSKFYTDIDTLIIATQNQDTIKYSKKDFNEIVDNFPELYADFPKDPDVTYHCSKQFVDVAKKNGNKEHISFGSEQGKDEYYILYAYFLEKQFDLKRYDTRKKILIEIYNDINEIYNEMNFGGTFFGHQHSRIIGYAEYSIYTYSIDSNFYKKSYGVTKQKKLYINSFRQLVIDELSNDKEFNPAVINPEDKKLLEMNLYKLIDKLDNLISDNFYLRCAQNFQYSHY